MAKAFASMNIGKMNLDRRCAAAGDGIAQGDRGVSIGAGIDDDARALRSRFLAPGARLSLLVALAERLRASQRTGPLARCRFAVARGGAAEYPGFSAPQKVEVGPVEHVDVDHREGRLP